MEVWNAAQLRTAFHNKELLSPKYSHRGETLFQTVTSLSSKNGQPGGSCLSTTCFPSMVQPSTQPCIIPPQSLKMLALSLLPRRAMPRSLRVTQYPHRLLRSTTNSMFLFPSLSHTVSHALDLAGFQLHPLRCFHFSIPWPQAAIFPAHPPQ